MKQSGRGRVPDISWKMTCSSGRRSIVECSRVTPCQYQDSVPAPNSKFPVFPASGFENPTVWMLSSNSTFTLESADHNEFVTETTSITKSRFALIRMSRHPRASGSSRLNRPRGPRHSGRQSLMTPCQVLPI